MTGQTDHEKAITVFLSHSEEINEIKQLSWTLAANKLRQYLDSPPPSSHVVGWRQIDNCPRNQSVILQCWWKHRPTSPYVFEGYLDWDGVTWHEQNGGPLRADLTDPVYWQPMPTPAIATEGSGE